MGLSEAVSSAAKNTISRIAEASKQNKNREETAADTEPVKQKSAPVANAEEGAEPQDPPSGQGDAPTADAEEGAKPVPPRRESALANADGGSNAGEEGGDTDQPTIVEKRQAKIDDGSAGDQDSQADLDEDVRQADLYIELAILDGEDGTATNGGDETSERGYEADDMTLFEQRGIRSFDDIADEDAALIAESLEEEQTRLEEEAAAITDGQQAAGGEAAAADYAALTPEERALLYQNVTSQESLLLMQEQALTSEGVNNDDGEEDDPALDPGITSDSTGVDIRQEDIDARLAEIAADRESVAAQQAAIAASFTTSELEALGEVTSVEYVDENGAPASYELNPEVATAIAAKRDQAIDAGTPVAVEVDGVVARPGAEPGTFTVTVPPNTSTTVVPGVQGQSDPAVPAVVPNAGPTALTADNLNGWTTPYYDAETPAGEAMVLGNPTGQPLSFSIQVDLGAAGVSGTSLLGTNGPEATATTTGEDGTPSESAAPPETPIDYTDGTHDEDLLNAAVFFGVIDPESRGNFRFADPGEMSPESGGGELAYTVQPGEGYWQAVDHVQSHPEGTNFNSNWSATWANNASRLGRTGANSDMLFAGEEIAISGWTRDSLAEAFTSAGLLPTTTTTESPTEETPTEEPTPTSGPVPEGPGDPDAIPALSDDPAEGGLATVSGNPQEDLAALEELVTLQDGTVVSGQQAADILFNSPSSDAEIPLTAASEDKLNSFVNGGEIPRQQAIDDLIILDAVNEFYTGLSKRYAQEAYMTGTAENAYTDGVNAIADDLAGMRTANDEFRTYLTDNPDAGATAPSSDLPATPPADATVDLAAPTAPPAEAFAAQTFTSGDGTLTGQELNDLAVEASANPTDGTGGVPLYDPAAAQPLAGIVDKVTGVEAQGNRDEALSLLVDLENMYVWARTQDSSYAEAETPPAEAESFAADVEAMRAAIDEYRALLEADPTAGTPVAPAT